MLSHALCVTFHLFKLLTASFPFRRQIVDEVQKLRLLEGPDPPAGGQRKPPTAGDASSTTSSPAAATGSSPLQQQQRGGGLAVDIAGSSGGSSPFSSPQNQEEATAGGVDAHVSPVWRPKAVDAEVRHMRGHQEDVMQAGSLGQDACCSHLGFSDIKSCTPFQMSFAVTQRIQAPIIPRFCTGWPRSLRMARCRPRPILPQAAWSLYRCGDSGVACLQQILRCLTVCS